MIEAHEVYLYGLFEILRHGGQSQLTQFEKQLEMRNRRNKRIAAAFISALIATRPERTFWMCAKSQDWWDRILMGTNFRVQPHTFVILWGKLKLLLHKRCMHSQLEMTVTSVTTWYLALGTDFKTLSQLFGIRKTSVSKCVWEVSCTICTINHQFINIP